MFMMSRFGTYHRWARRDCLRNLSLRGASWLPLPTMITGATITWSLTVEVSSLWVGRDVESFGVVAKQINVPPQLSFAISHPIPLASNTHSPTDLAGGQASPRSATQSPNPWQHAAMPSSYHSATAGPGPRYPAPVRLSTTDFSVLP